MIADKARAENIKNRINSGDFVGTLLIDVRGLPVRPNDSPLLNPYLRYTVPFYYVKYKIKSGYKRLEPFLLVCDLIPGKKLRFKNMKFLEDLVNGNVVDVSQYKVAKIAVKWLLENTNLNEDLLEIARTTYDTMIPIAFDMTTYNKKLNLLAGERTPRDSGRFNNLLIDKNLESFKREVLGVTEQLGIDPNDLRREKKK